MNKSRLLVLLFLILICVACKPLPCHGDILATVCEELNKEEN